MFGILLAAVLFLAYTNGANDNFKGVATLFGSGTTDYRKALGWATGTTLAGSLTSGVLGGKLLKAFSGKGLVPEVLTQDPHFLTAVGLGAAMTVLLATGVGLPISTTHALTGALVGSGLMAAFGAVHFGSLGEIFLLPLIASPILSIALTALVYPLLRWTRERLGIRRQMCLCLGESCEAVQPVPDGGGVLSTGLRLSLGPREQCQERYLGRIFGLQVQMLLNGFHFLSGGMVSFARGLNDTPKIVALLAASPFLSPSVGLTLVGLAMALGGIFNGRRVAHTMSRRITGMNDGQGFSANAVTAFLVLVASRFGLPVATTHVACGSLFGIGLLNGQARWGVIASILQAWVTTLPLGGLLGAAVYSCITQAW
jgi:PiT family inorganic phosphate transporter